MCVSVCFIQARLQSCAIAVIYLGQLTSVWVCTMQLSLGEAAAVVTATALLILFAELHWNCIALCFAVLLTSLVLGLTQPDIGHPLALIRGSLFALASVDKPEKSNFMDKHTQNRCDASFISSITFYTTMAFVFIRECQQLPQPSTTA